jgi:hypothetical protein
MVVINRFLWRAVLSLSYCWRDGYIKYRPWSAAQTVSRKMTERWEARWSWMNISCHAVYIIIIIIFKKKKKKKFKRFYVAHFNWLPSTFDLAIVFFSSSSGAVYVKCCGQTTASWSSDPDWEAANLEISYAVFFFIFFSYNNHLSTSAQFIIG